MAALTLIGGAIINGLAFTGSGYLFKVFDKNGALKEQKRHNEAMEKLSAAREKWSEHRVKILDYLNKNLKAKQVAEHDFRDVDYAFKLYNSFLPMEQKMPPLAPEPQLSNFYTPSPEQQNYEYLWIIGGTALIGFLAYKFT